MIIGKVYKVRERNGRKVMNVPYDQMDEPCHEGCCENALCIGVGTLSRSNWLLNNYMSENNLTDFDFNNWSEELEMLWKHWRETRGNH